MVDDFKSRGGSPWDSPPGGGNGSGRGPTPPDIEEIIRNIQKTINRFIPGKGAKGGKPLFLGLIILLIIWAASGLYRVLPDEQGVVLRFGKFVNTTQPGLNYHLPYPIETALTPKVTKVNRLDVGFRAGSDSGFSSAGIADVPEESLMLTGDENIVNIDFSVFWVIKDAGNFLFKIQDPAATVKAAAETAMREVIAKSKLQSILTEGRSKIEIETQEIAQSLLDEYESGIQIGAENIPENWRKGLFDYPLNEKSLKEIANNTYNRSIIKELVIFPFRQSLLFILIILHILYRAIGFVIFKR